MERISNELKNPLGLIQDLQNKGEDYWLNRGKETALKQFTEMLKEVPAYRKYLQQKSVKVREFYKSFEDLKDIPPTSKEDYLRKYTMSDLCWGGIFVGSPRVISATSGSTGQPFYFPRGKLQDQQYQILAHLYLLTNFSVDKLSTLYINAFPMGAWIGGLFTYEVITRIARENSYPLSIISPGVNKKEILNIVKKFGGEFDQIIIGSYGPFLKDILDDGEADGILWQDYRLNFVFSAEGFSEEFRDYIFKKAGVRENSLRSSLNHYGTVDQGTLSYETPLSILIRRLALKNKSLYREIFRDAHCLPTLTQYLPEIFYFEEKKSRLYCTSYSGYPLFRYDLGDNGGVIKYQEMLDIFKKHEIDIRKEAEIAGIVETVWKLPFVFVHERRDLSVSLYAFQIYPQTIKRVLEEGFFESSLTGKFTMKVDFDKQQNQYFKLHIELKYGVKESKELTEKIKERVIVRLVKENSEFRETLKEKGERIHPKVVLWPKDSEEYFKSGAKQKWAIN